MNGLLILAAYALIGIIAIFYQVTTPQERNNWADFTIRWLFTLATIAALIEFLPGLLQRLGLLS